MTAAEITGIAVGSVAIVIFGAMIAYICGKRPLSSRSRGPADDCEYPKTPTRNTETIPIRPVQTTIDSAKKHASDNSELEAAVHNLLGIVPLERRQWGQERGIGPSLYETRRQETVTSPAEMPCSRDPGNSPLPEYEEVTGNSRFSWTPADENRYRPAKQ